MCFLCARDTKKYHLLSNCSWTKRATELTKNSNCSPTNTIWKRFEDIFAQVHNFWDKWEKHMTAKNMGKTKVFSVVMLFFPLISKIMHLSKNVLKYLFRKVLVGLQFEFFVSSVALLVQYLMLDKWYFLVSWAPKSGQAFGLFVENKSANISLTRWATDLQLVPN